MSDIACGHLPLEVVDLPLVSDDRGFLFEVIRSIEPAPSEHKPHSLAHRFGQVYVVGDPVRKTVRAYHKHDELWDWFCIIAGSAKFVFVDDDPDSDTEGKHQIIIGSSRRPQLIVVPPKVYHGWMSLEDNTVMLSVASHTYNHAKPDEYRVDPYTFDDLIGESPWVVRGR